MRICQILVFLLFGLLRAGPLHAQDTASVSGFVRDNGTQETLILANIRLEGTPFGAATNNSGYYTLTDLPSGTYTLLASYVGYVTFGVTFELVPGEQRRLDVELVPVGVQSQGVVVSAERESEEESRQLGAAKMPTARIRELPSVLEPDVFRSLQLLPGVKASSDYSSGLYIRGGSPDQTLILLDRTTVYNPTHFFGVFSTFNPDAIKDVRLYKGAYPATYGGRIGSVVDIYNKDGNGRETHGTASLGLLASRAMVEGPHPVGSYMIAVRRSTLEPLLAAARSSDAEGIPETFYFLDTNGKVNFNLSQNDRIGLGFYAGQDVVRVPFLTDAEIRLRYGNRTGSLNWSHIFSERLFSNFTFTASRYFSLPVFEVSNSGFKRDNRFLDYSVKGDFEYIQDSRRTVRVGFWTGLFDFGLIDTFDNRDVFSVDKSSLYSSVFAEYTYRPTADWTLVSGLRTSWFRDGGYLRIEPRLSLERRLSDDVFLQAGYGRYYQYLTLFSNEVFTGLDIWLTSSEGVPPEYGDQMVAGIKMTPGSGYRVEIEGYYRTMRDLFAIDPFLPDAAGWSYDEFFHFGEGYAWGTELFLEKSFGRLSGFAGYTFGITRRRFPTINENEFYPPKYDRTHDLNVTTSYQLGRKWKLTSVFTYATGQAYTEPASQYRLVHSPYSNVDTDVLVSPFNQARLPAYHRLDLGLGKQGRFFGFADFNLQFQVVNVYSRRNIWFYVFDFDENGDVSREEVPQIPIPIPNISLTLQF